MKLRNIFITGLSVVALSSCSDYLDVEAPSKNDMDYVATDKVELNRALNGVYTGLLSGNTYGSAMFTKFTLNSDVDFFSNSSGSTTSSKYCRFDCDPSGGDLAKTWQDIYGSIELANLFVETLESSPMYDAENPDKDLAQMLGEAKVIRAIFYHDLIWMFGDVPFSFNSTKTTPTLIYPIKDRNEIIDILIKDLESVADNMQSSSECTVERPGKEMAWAMIARLALTAGGYQLRPDGNTYGKMVRATNYKDYYTTARDYTRKVIEAGTHHLSKDFHKVFVDECNFIVAAGDDPIFEIPFGKESTGDIGYIHGPKIKSYDNKTHINYGATSSGATLNAFYRYMFDEDDVRRDYINQLFYYDANATANVASCSNGYTVQNGKWSKLWVNGGLGPLTEGKTGINFPYMRYTDVLLMFAEADNEINDGPSANAIKALEEVRTRAFRSTNPNKISRPDLYGSKSDFLKAVLDERKFEFAGENMRWKDLVRNNMYSENTYWNFFRYYAIAQEVSMPSDYTAMVSMHDFGDDERYYDIPMSIYNIKDVVNDEASGYSIPENAFPNRDVKICRLLNPYNSMTEKDKNELGLKDVIETQLYNDWSSDDGVIKNEVHYSLLGYIYADENDVLRIVRNGTIERCPEPATNPTVDNLPVVRYILPIPQNVINRSNGQYVNQYGY
ncbi:RagB/SusD family nutrient uptake outer membrane protein [Alistipes sp. Z76]|nr:RagB/SusD family nutrient uptake outer membrane protein [Alistipes sp. Z76]NCE68350.1 RagB/SusD family nutrient uptake outer membrane protein [Muribaculaceae bacterium M3]